MKTIATKDFDRLLADVIDNDIFFLLSLPGVYQTLSEYYSDDVLAAWEAEQGDEATLDSMKACVPKSRRAPLPHCGALLEVHHSLER